MPLIKILAKAIYDNIAESTDELAFRKGDILTVIETDTSDLKGWWLCQLRGRQVGPPPFSNPRSTRLRERDDMG
ncbi:AAEL006729-PA [Aedes aegypti]|uniref:AAEL006729-PA n=1 Tax=Aedes aegypti TaxID=7159 RepID=Q174Y5_AEDAE|nr:AAEL006729-PA [Aedes aegypti]